MGVDLGGADIGMAEQALNDAQIRAVIDQMGGKGMAQTVRAEVADAGRFGIFGHNHPCQLAADAVAFLSDEQFVAAGVFQ